MPNLKTCICHSCGKFAEYPYQSTTDGELYHKVCLPETLMEEGYKYMSKEYSELADEMLSISRETFPPWEDTFQDRLNQDPRV